MNQFFLSHKELKHLGDFSHIQELALKKNTSIQLDSFCESTSEAIRIYYVIEGRFEWIIQNEHHLLYPGDLAIILPGQSFHGENNLLHIGSLFWIHIALECIEMDRRMILGSWSGLSQNESQAISRILQHNNTSVLAGVKEPLQILQSLHTELMQQQIGFATRVNHLIDELLILLARQSTYQSNLRRDFPKTFMKLEQALRQNLSHQWTVEEMAAMVGLGTTAFNEKVKGYTGFPPMHYLINIRISEAIKMLRKSEMNITAIALETGFYSSQHFSTTFKKLTGYTPGEFRKRGGLKI